LRCYGFEISVDGADRRHGSLDLLEDEVVSWDLPVMPATDEPVAGNVIELRPPQTLH
jgi:hypothetical protein